LNSNLLLEQLKRDPAHQKNSRLGVFGLGQFGFRAVETNRGQVVAERGVGAVEPRLGDGNLAARSLPMPTVCAPCPANNNAVLLISGALNTKHET
jgi:hypothetical protein